MTRHLLRLMLLLTALGSLARCGPADLDDDATSRDTDLATTRQALDPTPTITITAPANNFYFQMTPPATPVTVWFEVSLWGPYPAPGKSIRVYLDEALQQTLTEGSEVTLPDVPFGVHSVSLQLVQDGVPVPHESALATRYVRVTTSCTADPDCEEGNPCTLDGCIYTGNSIWECRWGVDTECCFTLFDCPWGTSFCADVTGDGKGECVECTTDADCDDDNPCSSDACYGGECVNWPAPDSCATDDDCDDDLFCTVDSCVQEWCACQHEPVPDCCDTDLDCDDASPCTLDRCIAHKCRHGPKFFAQSCCVDNEDCVPVSTCDVGTCILSGGDAGTCMFTPDPAKEGCCTSNEDCPNLSDKWLGKCLYNPGTEYDTCGFALNPEWCESDSYGLRISELMIDPVGVLDSLGEWLEVVNASDGPLDLADHHLAGPDGEDCHLFPQSSFVLQPGDTAVVARLADPLVNGGVAVDFECGLSLSLENGTDSLQLLAPDSNPVDAVAWDDSWPKVPGAALARVSPYLDGALAASWQPATQTYGPAANRGTPGQPNTDLGPLEDPPLCDDGIPCTLDLCSLETTNYCTHLPLSACCQSDTDCTDGNACTQDACSAFGTCSHTTLPGCCSLHDECDDGDPCTLDKCINHACRHGPLFFGEVCCQSDTDCNEDNPCVIGTCIDQVCHFEAQPGCCLHDYQCYDGNPCTADACSPQTHACSYTPVPGCCLTLDECEAQKPPEYFCRPSDCIAWQCKYGPPAPGCCATPGDCDDGLACTVDTCDTESHLCTHEETDPLCCATAADCPVAPDPCQEPACVANHCQYSAIPDCCQADGQCDDGNPCTEDACLAQFCHHVVAEGSNCCQSVQDCPDDGLRCTETLCVDQTCTHEAASPCFLDLDYAEPDGLATQPAPLGLAPFFGGNQVPPEPPAWELTSVGQLGPAWHLSLAVATGQTPCLATPYLRADLMATHATLGFEAALDFPDGQVLLEVWQQEWPEEHAWTPLFVHIQNEAGLLHKNVTVPITPNPTGYRRFAICTKSYSGPGTLELDNLVVATGSPPAFISSYPTIPIQAGQSTSRSLRATDPDLDPLTISLVNSPGFVTLTPTQMAGGTNVWQTLLLATPHASYPASIRQAIVRVYDTLLYDQQTIALHVLSGPCTDDDDCDDGNGCTAHGCVAGNCSFQAITPCCGNAVAESGEQCDDGNTLPYDGCSPQCTLEDNDWDGLFDTDDNCPGVANPAQEDLDQDGHGDACDTDWDGDGVPNPGDNCPEHPNGGQADNDGDGQGNVCDPDDDNDGHADAQDNCPFAANSDQADNDGDSSGDACDTDDDNDGLHDGPDNCPLVANPDQDDQDGDTIGDLCDSDADGDGYEVPHDCDDADPGIKPQWAVLAPPAAEGWRWSPRVALDIGLLYAAAPHGEDDYEAWRLTAAETSTRLTNDDEDYLPLAASDQLSAWSGPGNNLVLGTGLGFLPQETPVLQLDEVAVDGLAAVWVEGNANAGELHLYKDGPHFQLTDDDVGDHAPAISGSHLLWARGGEIFYSGGFGLLPVTSDSILDESPVAWQGEAVWVRHSGPGGAGNISHLDLATGALATVTNDLQDDRQVALEAYGAAWIRAGAMGDEVLFWNRAEVTQLTAGQLATVEQVVVGSHFVAWSGLQEGTRNLWAYDGHQVVTLDGHLPPLTRLVARGNQLGWVSPAGPRLARWVCTSLVDLDGDGEPAQQWGGSDCDDADATVAPIYQTIALSMGATQAPSAPSIHGGQVVWSAFDGQDREVYLYDGKGVIQLTDNSENDLEPALYAGNVVWVVQQGDSTEIMRYDGETLGSVDDSSGGRRPQSWGQYTAWLVPAGNSYHIGLHHPDVGATQITQLPISGDHFHLFSGRVVWATQGNDSEIMLYDLESGQTETLGLPFSKDQEPRVYGDRVVWRHQGETWQLYQWDGTLQNLLVDAGDDITEFSLAGDRTLWSTDFGDESDLFLRHADGVVERLTMDQAQDSQLALDQSGAAWIRGTGDDAEVVLWLNGFKEVVTDDAVEDRQPAIHAGQVAWIHGDDVYLRKVACGPDLDQDGQPNSEDNCPDLYNPNQTDLDQDGAGDTCDPDDDGDLVLDPVDNCPSLMNVTQSDVDGDGQGDECDPDADGDGHLSTIYGGDDCNDIDADSVPTWPGEAISGGIADATAPELSEEAAVWQGTLFGHKQIFMFRDGTLYQVTANTQEDENPRIAGSLAVWEHHDGNDKEIWYSDLDAVYSLTDNDYNDRQPHTDGERIVWYAKAGPDYEIFQWDGSQVLQVTINSKNDYHPHISGNLVVWRGFDGHDYEIYMKKGGAIYNLSNNETDDGIPSIQGSRVIWAHHDGNDFEIAVWEDEVIELLTDNDVDDLDPVLDGNRALWRRDDGHDFEIVFYTGSVVVQLTNDDREKGPPRIDSGRVVWAARDALEDWEIFTHKAGKIVQVTDNDIQDISPNVIDDTIYWKCDNAICRAPRTCP